MAKAAFTLFCFVDTIGIGTMAPTVFGHAEYRVGADKSRLLPSERPRRLLAPGVEGRSFQRFSSPFMLFSLVYIQ